MAHWSLPRPVYPVVAVSAPPRWHPFWVVRSLPHLTALFLLTYGPLPLQRAAHSACDNYSAKSLDSTGPLDSAVPLDSAGRRVPIVASN